MNYMNNFSYLERFLLTFELKHIKTLRERLLFTLDYKAELEKQEYNLIIAPYKSVKAKIDIYRNIWIDEEDKQKLKEILNG